ncbi:MAG: DNA (cytosine-5-)-methyltransferase [Acidimicrobiia bacterium]
MKPYSIVSMFTGAGGLDLGFEQEGFHHLECVDLDPWSIDTLRQNRPDWSPVLADARVWSPVSNECDVLIAGPPCQGFSLGGHRRAADDRNKLFREVVRVAESLKPRVVLIENVLNLRTMIEPESGKPFAYHIASELERSGYEVRFDIFRMAHHGVPQTRRRFVFVAFKNSLPNGYQLPAPGPITTIRPYIYDLAQAGGQCLPNHDPRWGFDSAVHVETGQPFDETEEVVPVRFSRTASDGNPIRSFDAPFPAVDTATIWGWAQGGVQAARFSKDRKNGKHIRNPDANVTLWRVTASRLRAFTHREYARLQTFPDEWEFIGGNKRDVHLQIGNAVPVEFARRLARNIRLGLEARDKSSSVRDDDGRLTLF